MNVNDMQDLIETLQKRIRDHRNDLMASEALTRYALVDPLLRELGWDTGDPGQVRPEYLIESSSDTTKKIKPGSDTTKKFADYVLFKDGQKDPSVLIEAKSLSMGATSEKGRWPHLRDAAIQAVGYCLTVNIRYAAVTDGQRWEIYDTYQSGETRNASVPVLDRMWLKSFDLVEQVDLFDQKGDLSINGCRLAGELWRDNPNPKGTKRIVEAGEVCLNAEGYVLGRWSKKGRKPKESYPPNAQYWVEGRFLDVNGYRLKKNGDPYSGGKPYEPSEDYEGRYQYQQASNQTSQPHPGPKSSMKPSQASQEPEPTRDRKEWGLGYELPSQTSQARR